MNPVVEFIGLPSKFDEQQGTEFLTHIQVVIDALDNIPTRMRINNQFHTAAFYDTQYCVKPPSLGLLH